MNNKYNPEFNNAYDTNNRIHRLIWSAHLGRFDDETTQDELKAIDGIYIEIYGYLSEQEKKDYEKLYNICLKSKKSSDTRNLFIYIRSLKIVMDLTMKHTDEMEGMFDD